MVELKRIQHPDNAEFVMLMELYESAFPQEERREVSELAVLLETEDRMHFNAVYHDGNLAGLFVYWKLDGFWYLEHLAVYAQLRNHKIGEQVLDWTARHLEGIRLLEAEPAEGEMPTRRIRYYERNGFIVCDKNYHQPSYRKGGKGIDLWVLCTEEPADLPAKIATLKQVVYGC